MDEDEHEDLLGHMLLGVQALLRCGNLTEVNLYGATFSLFIIRSLAQSCPNIRSLSLCAITDPDDGSSLLALATSGALETLNVSCWFELSDESVLHLVSGCVSLRSMVVSHCKDLTISDGQASSRRPQPSPFQFMPDPRCTPTCLPPNRKCSQCMRNLGVLKLTNRALYRLGIYGFIHVCTNALQG